MKILVAPSILAADFSHLEAEIHRAGRLRRNVQRSTSNIQRPTTDVVSEFIGKMTLKPL
jgi:hypothetical protein